MSHCGKLKTRETTHAIGDRIALRGQVSQTTAFDPISMAGVSAARVLIVVIALSQFASLDVYAFGSNDRANWTPLGSTTINGQYGAFTFEVTQVAFAWLKLAAQAYNGAGTFVFSLGANLANP